MTPARLPTLLLFLCLAGPVFAQVPQLLSQPERRDTLPFAIADEKRLPDEELAEKKEGAYLTGLPDISSDPLNGFGLGAELELYLNGKRTDPFFAYVPYKHLIGVQAFYTTRAQRELILTWDAPYIARSKWRLRGEVGYERNPNLVYFGQTADESLQPLSLRTRQGAEGQTHKTYAGYEGALPDSASHFDQYDKEEYILNVSAEHSYLEGRFRLLAGLELAYVNIRTFDGRSRLREDDDRTPGLIRGLGPNILTNVQFGAVYDTRNFESDPSAGVFAEVTEEIFLPGLGSPFTFFKTFAQAKRYQKLWGARYRGVLAGRIAGGYTAGDAPFYEYQDQWSSEGSIEGLGGPNTLRGFKQSRFLGRATVWANLELRQRFISFKALKQGFTLDAVPFLEAGTVSDDVSGLFKSERYRANTGLGLRLAWNLSTIVRLDYAVSNEDRQLFLGLGHAF